MVVVACVYQIQRCVRLLRRGVNHGNAITQLSAWTVLVMTAGLDLTYWLGFGAWHRGSQGAAVGLTVSALLQTLAFSREHLRAMRETRALNVELRRQVSARSRMRCSPLRTRVLARFAREAHIASQVSQANLVSIHDIDFASDGFMYIVMELVPGGPLSAYRQRFGDVPWALEVLSQTARGLAALHDSGVVHRDLKPANILLQEGESVVARIGDFGGSGMADNTASELVQLARSPARGTAPTAVTAPDIDERHETLGTASIDVDALERRAAFDSPLLTQAGHLLGTPAYVAPELHEGVDSSPVRDAFGFGTLAFELLTGERPYATPPLLCRLRRQTTDEARRLTDTCPTLEPELARQRQAAVSLVPVERPAVAMLVAAFERRRS